MWYLYPREDQKPGIVGYQVDVATTHRLRPSDELIPISRKPGGGAEKQTSKVAAKTVFDDKFQILPYGSMKTKIMVLVQIISETGIFIRTSRWNMNAERGYILKLF